MKNVHHRFSEINSLTVSFFISHSPRKVLLFFPLKVIDSRCQCCSLLIYLVLISTDLQHLNISRIFCFIFILRTQLFFVCCQVQQRLLELLVLECSPVTQGRITADTSLVLTDCLDSVDPPCVPLPCRPLRLCVSDFAHYADSLGGGRSLLDNRNLLGSGFSGVLQALECRLDVRVVDTQRWLGVKGQQGAAVDVDSCVFVSKQLLLRHGLFNQEWVRLSRPSGSSRPPTGQTDVRGVCRERLVSVVVMDLNLSPDLQIHGEVGFISAALWFNLTQGDVIPVNSCTLRMKVISKHWVTAAAKDYFHYWFICWLFSRLISYHHHHHHNFLTYLVLFH